MSKPINIWDDLAYLADYDKDLHPLPWKVCAIKIAYNGVMFYIHDANEKLVVDNVDRNTARQIVYSVNQLINEQDNE